MLANNTNKMVWVGIALGLVGVLGGSLMMIYPDAYDITRTAIVKEMSGFTSDSTPYAQKTVNVYVPYAIVPGKGILIQNHDKVSFGDNSNEIYTMKDSSFIKDKYHVQADSDGMYSDYSLDGTVYDASGTGKSRVGFYDQPDIAPLMQNGKMSNIKILQSFEDVDAYKYALATIPGNAVSFSPTGVVNNTGRSPKGLTLLSSAAIYDSDVYVVGQNGIAEKGPDFVGENHVLGGSHVFGSLQSIGAVLLGGWHDADYSNTTPPKDSSLDGFYSLGAMYNFNLHSNTSELASAIKDNNIPNNATLQYVGKLHINFHFVDVGYDKTPN